LISSGAAARRWIPLKPPFNNNTNIESEVKIVNLMNPLMKCDDGLVIQLRANDLAELTYLP
jgi:hypothetical protein